MNVGAAGGGGRGGAGGGAGGGGGGRQPQRGAADPTLSVWVSASAGTGKTKVLVDRVLRLLLAGTRPERILCLTFTRAAAAEMAVRINGELAGWTRLDDDALDGELAELTVERPDDDLRRRARRLFATALDTPGGFKIMTIHAFCQSLLGRFPIEAGVAPHFEVLDERTAAETISAARDTVLREAHSRKNAALADALDEVTRHTGAETVFKLLDQMLGARGRLRALMDRHGGLDGVIGNTYRLLGVEAGATAGDAIAAACADGAFNAAGLRAACAALDGGSKTDKERARLLRQWLDADAAGRERDFGDYLLVFMTRAGAPRAESGLMTKPVRTAHPDAFETLLNEQRGVVAVIERRNAAVVAAASAAILRLGGAVLARYDLQKALRAGLDYDDLVQRAGALLRAEGVAPWVLYKLDGGLDHILVDEAQDTSPDQWRVIAALADEFFVGEGARDALRTVFVVGDEKQSIFSFQGADLAELQRMRDHFAGRAKAADLGFDEVGLGDSYRSTGPVLRAVDAVFARDAARDGVAFAGREVRHRAVRAGHAGTVELWPLVVESAPPAREPWTPAVEPVERETASARLARHIARTIGRWLDEGERLESRGRAVRPGDIMVLVRTRKQFVAELVRALKERRIPVAGADRMKLSDQLAVMDLVALGSFLLLAEDDLTLATVLKGPLVGLDEDALFALAWDRGDDSLWRVLIRRRGERDDFGRAHAFLEALLARADFVPPYELFAGVLGAGGGRRKLVARLGPDANDPIDEFLSLALEFERSGPPSLQGFLHWLEAGDVEVKRDLEHGRDEVRVMTVHGAKGLQAPIVFLPDTTGTPPAGGARLLWHEAGGGTESLLWPPSADYAEACCAAARAAERARAMAEYRRLLYVAMTRAEDRLYVCGWQNLKGVSDDSWYRLIEAGIDDISGPFDFDSGNSSDGGQTDGGWSGTGRRLAEPQTRSPVRRDGAAGPPADAGALPDFARRPPAADPEPPRPLAPSRPKRDDPARLSPLAGGPEGGRFLRGRLIHRLLEVLPDVAPEGRAAACRRFLARPANGLDEAAREAIADEVMAVLDHPGFAPLFGPGSMAEVPLVGVVGGHVVSGQVDRLVVRKAEVMIVDYKSNVGAPGDESEVPEAYLDQMAAYRAVLAMIYPDKSIVCALLWSDGPRLMQLSDELLAGRALGALLDAPPSTT